MTSGSSCRLGRIVSTLSLFFLIAAPGLSAGTPIPPHRIGQVLPFSILLHDSTFFDPEGYYFPVDSVIIDGYWLESVSIRVTDYIYATRPTGDSAAYYPWGMLLLAKRGEEETAGYTSKLGVVAADSLDLVFPHTPFGEVRLRGAFSDKRGRFGQRGFPQDAVLLKANLSRNRDGRWVDSRPIAFTYWEGD